MKRIFLELSSALTGIAIDSFTGAGGRDGKGTPSDVGDLSPHNTPIDLADIYLAVLQEEIAAGTLSDLWARFEAADEKFGNAAHAAETLSNHQVFGPLCRSIMKLWFFGIWYSPLQPERAVKVVSSQTYKEGLIWKVLQAHPMGYSTLTFGYWSHIPPPLDQFITIAT